MVFQIILLTLWLVVVRGRKEREKGKRKEIVGKVSILRCVWNLGYLKERKEFHSFPLSGLQRGMK